MIRNANKSDCLNLAALSIQVYLHTYAREGIRNEISTYVMNTFTEEYFKGLLNDNNYRVLVFTEENHLLGFIVINLESFFDTQENGYEVDTLYVQDHFKGKGIGQSLLLEIRSRFGNNHWLSTWIRNDDAIGFYEHIGFEQIGTNYFDLDGEQIENRVLAYR